MEENINITPNEEAGRKGGVAAAYAPGYAGAAAVPDEAETTLGTIHWKGVWAGFVTATALALWLAVIGYALFPPNVLATPGITGSVVTGPSDGFYIWTAIGYLLALFVGGYLTSQLGRAYKTANAVGNGIALWGLTFTLLFMLTSIGAGGVAGRFISGPALSPVGPGLTADAIRASVNGAWWFALFQFLGLLVAIGGAVVGLRASHVEEERAVT